MSKIAGPAKGAASSGLNADQLAAATAGSGPHLVIAGPGTGKTTTLIARFLTLVERGAVPSRIFVGTFTKEAADSMRTRIGARLGMARKEMDGLWIGTFHSLASQLLGLYARRLGLPATFRIVDDRWQKQIFREMNITGGRGAAGAITGWKERMIDPAEAHELADAKRVADLGLGKYRNKQHPIITAAQLYADYQSRLDRMGACDFADLINRIVRALENDADLRGEVGSRFDHLLVDEYQDVNIAQVRLLKALAAGNGGIANLWAVGDDDQSVYGFRSSDVRFILNFSDDFPGARIHELRTNYRSTRTIVDASRSVIGRNAERYAKNLVAARAAGKSDSPIIILGAADERAEAGQVVDLIRRFVSSGIGPGKIAVLFRSAGVAEPLLGALAIAGLPYVAEGPREFWKHPEVKAFLGMLRIAVNGAADKGAAALLGRGEQQRDFSRTAADLHARSAAAGDGYPAALQVIAASIEGQAPSLQPQRASQWRENCRIAGEAARRAGSLPALLRVIAGQDGGAGSGGRGEALTLATLHAAKGLEWPVVIVIGCEDDELPHRLSEDRAEERRLFYVGLTRAQNVCVLSYCVFRNGRDASPSPFIQEAVANLSSDQVRVISGAPPSGAAAGQRAAGKQETAQFSTLAAVPRTLRGVAELLEAKGEMDLFRCLYRGCRLVRYRQPGPGGEPGLIELRKLPGVPEHFESLLADRLGRFTGVPWDVLASRQAGQPPLVEQDRGSGGKARSDR